MEKWERWGSCKDRLSGNHEHGNMGTPEHGTRRWVKYSSCLGSCHTVHREHGWSYSHPAAEEKKIGNLTSFTHAHRGILQRCCKRNSLMNWNVWLKHLWRFPQDSSYSTGTDHHPSTDWWIYLPSCPPKSWPEALATVLDCPVGYSEVQIYRPGSMKSHPLVPVTKQPGAFSVIWKVLLCPSINS